MTTVVGRCWEALERARVARTLRESEARLRAGVEAPEWSTCVAHPDRDVSCERIRRVHGHGSKTRSGAWATASGLRGPRRRGPRLGRATESGACSRRARDDVEFQSSGPTGRCRHAAAGARSSADRTADPCPSCLAWTSPSASGPRRRCGRPTGRRTSSSPCWPTSCGTRSPRSATASR